MNIKQLEQKYNEWGKHLPRLFECFSGDTHVRAFREGSEVALTTKHRETIKRIEARGKEYHTKVIAVLEGAYLFPQGETVFMTSYVVVDKDSEPVKINDRGMFETLAFVDNTSWDIQEWGMIAVKESLGLVFRIG